MRMPLYFKFCKAIFFLILCSLVSGKILFAQQTLITDYVIFGGKTASGQTTPASPGYGVQINSSCNIMAGVKGGIIGSYNLIQSTGNLSVAGSIYSGGNIQLSNSNSVSGNLSAASSSGTVISVGSSASIGGNINANGNIKIGRGTVTGTVTHPTGTTYTGPVPGGGNVTAVPNIPILPVMPPINVFPAVGSTNITSTKTITPGSYGNVTLGGNKTLTLSGTGVYVFNSIQNSGAADNFVFDFKNAATGNFIIYVYGDVNLGKVGASMVNGGSESRIYLEAHGTGSSSSNGTISFNIANGSGNSPSKWIGSVWAPYAAINIGSGTGNSSLTGALWSGTQVVISSGNTIVYSPFNLCTPPTAVAGTTITTCSNAGAVNITAGSGATNYTGVNWTSSGTGTFANATSLTTATYTPSKADSIAGSVTLTLTATGNATCGNATSTKTLTIVPSPRANAGPNQSTCSNSGPLNITGASASNQTGINWTTSGTGTFTNGNTLMPIYTPSAADSIAGSVVLTLTATSNSPCSNAISTKTLTIIPAPTANAGPDQALDVNSQAMLSGTSTSANVSFSWQAINGGMISTSTNQAMITVSTGGTYVLTVTDLTTGCFATDTAIVTSKTSSVVGSELQSIVDTYNPNTQAPPSPFFQISPDGYVTIDIIVNAGYYNYVLALLQTATYGLRNIIPNGASSFIITGQFPIMNLPLLNSLGTYINYCRPYYSAVINNGLVSSAGDTTMRSNLVRSGYNINGAGIKVGVISNSFATITSGTIATPPLQPTIIPPYAVSPLGTLNPTPQTFTTNTSSQDITNDDLPGVGNPKGFTTPVTVLQDFPIQESDEGRAMLQIVHDVAPGAQLYFRTGYFSAGDFALGIKQLSSAGCNVIVDDMTYITEPFLQDGIVAKTVDTVTSQGVTYFSAAGNFANRSYESNFTPIDATSIGFPGKKAHNFSGTGDMFQHVRLAPGNYTIVLQWVDSIYSIAQAGGTKNDLDIYLTPNTDGTALIGFNRDNTNGDPIEFIPLTISGTDSVDYNILIVNNTTTSNPSRIKYVVFSGGMRIMEYNVGTSTLVGQANADSAIAVGAARYNYVPNYINKPPAGYPIAVPNNPANPATNLTEPSIESFSSIGGTQTNGIVRNKPDLVAPDGVKTTVQLGQDYPDWALTGYSNFFGTSAAAPHAAAVAALIMQGRNKFLGQATTTSSQVRKLLQTTATSMKPQGLVGYDYTSGYGLINADSAMRTFAVPTPELDSLIIPKTTPITIPGDTVFTVTVKGQNFSSSSIVYYKDSALASTVVLSNNAATAIIPLFDDNPAISVYTPPLTKNKDGGFSNNLYFFQGSIVVSADSITKKYGELLPVLDTTITINGVLLKDTTLTLANIGLSKLTLNTAATTNSDVGTYIITPSGNLDPSNPVDSAFLVTYHYKFNNGAVTINQMPLTVTPNNQTINYGQYLNNVTYTYNYDRSNIPNPTSLDSLIKAYHQNYLPGNALAVVNGFSNKQSDGSVLTSAALANLNMIASFNAVNNSRKFQLDNNNNLVPLTNQNSLNIQYLVDVASASIFDYKNNPAIGNFYRVYPGVNSKALLGAAALSNNNGQVYLNKSLVPMINGSLVPMVNSATGSLVPIINGSLVQILNGSLVQLVNGIPTPIASSSLVQLVNGQLVQLVNGVSTPIADNTLVQLVNGTLVQMVNGTLAQIVNGSLVQLVNGQYVPVTNSSLVQLVNSTLVQYVNGAFTAVPNGSLVQLINGSVYQMTNGSLQQLVNGNLVPLINGTLVPIINSSLVQIINGSLMQLVNGSLVPLINGSLVQMVNGSLVQMVNSSLVQIINSSLVQLVNGIVTPLPNGSLVQLVNSNSIGASSANNNTGVIIDTTDANPSNNYWIGPMFGINMITGLNPGQQSLVPGVLVNSNFNITYGLGTVTIKPDTIIVTAKDTTREYGSPNPAFKVTYSGFASGDNLQNSVTGSPSFTTASVNSSVGTYPITPIIGSLASTNYVFKFVSGTLTIFKDTLTVKADSITRPYGIVNPPLTATFTGFASGDNVTNSITGSPALSTTATTNSPAGTYPITIGNGSMSSINYYLNLVNGVFTVTNNSCLLTHSTFTNFSSTSKSATSLWLNIKTDINGELTTNGDFIVFTGGTVTLNNISSTPAINNVAIPNGKIIADNTVSAPVTNYDLVNNIWVTRVPLNYKNSSGLFITGLIINSSNGFTKNSNANLVVNGILYSNKNSNDGDHDEDWGYSIAAYQPQFTYATIAGSGQVASITGTYPAGTPIPVIKYIVSGGSGSGGKNYSGTNSSFDDYNACIVSSSSTVITGRANNTSLVQEQTDVTSFAGDIQIIPNPASNYITVSFVPAVTGNSKINLFTIDGRKVLEVDNGICEAGFQYQKKIDVSKFITGMYIVQVSDANNITTKKVIITR